jgi:hypothetical protein
MHIQHSHVTKKCKGALGTGNLLAASDPKMSKVFAVSNQIFSSKHLTCSSLLNKMLPVN